MRKIFNAERLTPIDREQAPNSQLRIQTIERWALDVGRLLAIYRSWTFFSR